MILDFSFLEEAVIYNQHGGNGPVASKLFCDSRNKIMERKIFPGSSIGEHTLYTTSEMNFVVSGKGYVIYDGEKALLEPGKCHYCPKGHTQSFYCPEDAIEPLVLQTVVSEK